MKYFWIVLLVVTTVQAYPRKFYYDGEIYSMNWDTENVSNDFFQECRKQTVIWRMERSKELKEHPYNYISQYINATPCDRTIAKSVANELWRLFPGTEKNSEEYANFVTAFVNSYFYKYDTAPEFQLQDPSYKNIFDTFNYSGDCEDLALLLAALFSNSCLDTAFMIWNDDGRVTHATPGVCVPASGTYVMGDNGKEYFVVEAVGGGGTKYQPNKVGNKSSVMKGSVTHFSTISKRNCS